MEEHDNSPDTPVKYVKFNVGGPAFNTTSPLTKIDQEDNLICSLVKDTEGKYIQEFFKAEF